MEVIAIFLNVDIHCPSKLRERDFGFLVLCEQAIPPGDKTKKLMAAFYDKENYTIARIDLQYCLKKRIRI